MPKIKKETKRKADIVSQEARDKIRLGYKTKKKKQRKLKTGDEISASPQFEWFEDPLQQQSPIFFDGYSYWLTKILTETKFSKKDDKEIKDIYFVGLNQEQWEERNKKGV